MDIVNKVVDYLRSSKAELQKVTWPSKQDTIRYSALVIGASVIMAIFFGFLDQSMVKGVEAIISGRKPAVTTPVNTAPTNATVPDLVPVNVETAPAANTAPIDLNAAPTPTK